MPKPSNTVSYSRIGVYLECPEMYRQRYLLKNKEIVPPLEEALIKGNLAHACIEEYLKGAEKDIAISVALRAWLKDCCNIDPTDSEEVAKMGGHVDCDALEEYAKKCGELLMRCSEAYTEFDKIRNKDGSCPKDPLEYPPVNFRMEYQKENLDQLKFKIDNEAVRANNCFKRFSLANIAATAVSYVYIFELPDFVSKVEGVELDLSTNPVAFRDGRYYWNGVIDTIYGTEEGATIINDHKTEKNKRRPEDVAFDLQLNSYASVRYEQTSKLPDYISITHLASNTINAATTDPEIVNLCMDYLEEVQKEIDFNIDHKGDSEPWLKKWPSKYGSPCLRRNWRTGNIERACPYIQNCWPQYVECIKEEIEDFFGLYEDVEQELEIIDVDF